MVNIMENAGNIYYIHGKNHGLGDLRTPSQNGTCWNGRVAEAYTLERSHPRHRCDRCDDTSLGSEKENCPNQHQPKISKDFQMFPPISTSWASLSIFTAPFLLLFCVLCVILCVWQWIEKNQRIRAARVVPSGLAPLVMSWDRRKPHVNLLRSSWEIGTIGTNITQHGKHTKSYWKSPSLMSKSM